MCVTFEVNSYTYSVKRRHLQPSVKNV